VVSEKLSMWPRWAWWGFRGQYVYTGAAYQRVDYKVLSSNHWYAGLLVSYQIGEGEGAKERPNFFFSFTLSTTSFLLLLFKID
jgi:hypothetical protein